MKRIILSVIAAALAAAASPAVADHAIFDVELAPRPPARLTHGTEIQVSFRYRTSHRPGVRIFARPMTRGSLSPNYAAAGSPLYDAGRGEGRATFTVRSGEVTVDEIRFQMLAADSRAVLHETRVRAGYRFAALPRLEDLELVEGGELRPIGRPELEVKVEKRPVLGVIEPVEPVGPARPGGSGGSQEPPAEASPCDCAPQRIVHPDGSVEFVEPDGTRRIVHPDGRRGFKAPGSDTWQYAIALQVQRALPPDELMSLDEEWLEGMNAWLEVVADDLLGNIRSLSGSEQAVDTYLQFEEQECSGLYEQIHCRMRIVSTLTGGL